MEGYLGVYQGKPFEVYAGSSDDAVNKAAALLKVDSREKHKIKIIGTFIACPAQKEV